MSVIRRLYGLRRVGHCGTLDPFADGLLPVVVGRATRAVQYMDGFDKAYRVRIRFGRRTDTMDLTGTTLEERPIPDDRMRRLVDGDDPSIHEAISSLVHIRSQVPPMYSAVKVEGRPLYDYARAGRDIERAARPVTIHEATVLQVAADETGLYTDALIRCSKGTYIRSLADTVGQATGLLAHASALTRLENGPYTLDQAFSWSQIMDAIDAGVRLPSCRSIQRSTTIRKSDWTHCGQSACRKASRSAWPDRSTALTLRRSLEPTARPCWLSTQKTVSSALAGSSNRHKDHRMGQGMS